MFKFRITITSICLLTVSYVSIPQQKSIQERLGYPKETKLLIIHADDMGVSHSENMATIHTMERGVVSSASITVPCPGFPEAAEYAKSHPEADLGLHRTLTSEWKNYMWGPVASSDQVRSLIDDHGYFYNKTGDVMKNGKAVEVEKELRAQIERVIRFGINPTHFDSHMASGVSTPEILKVYIKLGREFKVPILLSREVGKLFNINLEDYTNEKDIFIEKFVMATYETYRLEMENFYTEQIKAMTPGLTVIFYMLPTTMQR
ncbi:polysaccharide deacetylase family protein [Pollutibacter soli]|uniref:polysaccharide deacetylase family protein n=1 Tax=Pollutibacter soli TaxID=3034157 RepID=UPI00301362F1